MTERLQHKRKPIALTGVASISLLAAFGSLQNPETNNSKVANTQIRPLMGRLLIGRLVGAENSYMGPENELQGQASRDHLLKLDSFKISGYMLVEEAGQAIVTIASSYKPEEFKPPAQVKSVPIKAVPAVQPSTPAQVIYVDSTSYCLTSQTAEGGYPYSGVVAMSDLPFGTTVQVITGSEAGAVLQVEDRPDDKTQFDIWMNSCAASWQYGRQEIEIKILHEGT